MRSVACRVWVYQDAFLLKCCCSYTPAQVHARCCHTPKHAQLVKQCLDLTVYHASGKMQRCKPHTGVHINRRRMHITLGVYCVM
jgi:hypothetical protein